MTKSAGPTQLACSVRAGCTAACTGLGCGAGGHQLAASCHLADPPRASASPGQLASHEAARAMLWMTDCLPPPPGASNSLTPRWLWSSHAQLRHPPQLRAP